MENEYISRSEYEEHNKRMEDEHKRTNKRIELLEAQTNQIALIATSVEKLAISMQGMEKEQVKQGERLEQLEGRDGQLWREIVKVVATGIAGAVVGYILKSAGIF